MDGEVGGEGGGQGGGDRGVQRLRPQAQPVPRLADIPLRLHPGRHIVAFALFVNLLFDYGFLIVPGKGGA